MEWTPLFIALKERPKCQRNYKVKMKTILEYLGGKNVITFDTFFGRSSCKTKYDETDSGLVLPFPLKRYVSLIGTLTLDFDVRFN